MKDAMNVLVVVNAQKSDLQYVEEYNKNGERKYITEMIPGAPSPGSVKYMAYPIGIFLYAKSTLGPIGFYGSCFGVTFRAASQKREVFSVGMDSPNSAFGGSNCIRALAGYARAAADLANDTGRDREGILIGKFRVQVRRAEAMGAVNYGLCIVDEWN